MAKVWFRRRTRGLGIGYGPASVEGLIVLFGAIFLFTATVRLGMTWAAGSHLPRTLATLVVAVPLLIELAAFFWLVRAKSDDGRR